MPIPFPSVDPSTGQLPLSVREAIAANLADGSTVEGSALSAAIVAGTAGAVTGSSNDLRTALDNQYGAQDLELPAGGLVSMLPGALHGDQRQNGMPFLLDSVITVDGTQFAIWLDSNLHPIIGKRLLPRGSWETFDLAMVAGNPLAAPVTSDPHYTCVIGIDADGYIHVSGNMHADALRYARSSNPFNIGAWEIPTMIGTLETSVSYPMFVGGIDREMLFVYRDGISSQGRIVVNVYDTASKTWSRRSVPIDGGTTDGPYLNRPHVDGSGVLHLFFLFRNGSSGINGPAIGYLKSSDGGITFTDAVGTVVTLPVTAANLVPITSIANTAGQGSADTDDAGRPHSAYWGTDAAVSTNTALHHVWHDGTAWHDDAVVSGQTSGWGETFTRASVACYGGHTYLIYSLESAENVEIVRLRDLTGPPKFDIPIIEAQLGGWHPTYDTQALRKTGVLNMLVSPGRATTDSTVRDYTSYAWGGVVSIPILRMKGSVPLAKANRRESVWMSPSEFGVGAGSASAVTVSATPLWTFPDAASSMVRGTIMIPLDWPAVNVDVWWANAGAGAGSVTWQLDGGFLILTRQLSSSSRWRVFPQASGVASTAQSPVVTRVMSGWVIMDDGTPRIPRIGISRLGADAGDTLTNDAYLIGVMLTRAELSTS